MLLPFVISHELPLTDPVLKFLLILVIILSAPFIIGKTKCERCKKRNVKIRV